MKKTMICLLAGTAIAVAAFRVTPSFQIEATIKGNSEGKKVYLACIDKGTELIDSGTVQKGKIRFKGQLNSPRFLSLIFKEPPVEGRASQDKALNFFADNANIKVDAVYDSLKMTWQLSGGSRLSPADVKGSASHDLYLQYHLARNEYDKNRSALFDQYIRLINSGRGKKKAKYNDGIALCRQMDVQDSLRKAAVLQFIGSQAPNEVTAFVAKQALSLQNINTTDVQQLTARFSGAAQKGTLVEDFLTTAHNAKATVLGSELVNFELADRDGKMHRLSDYIGKGKYVLLEFWASWCGPCRADIPHLKEVYELYHSKGFEIVSISLDENKEKWLTAMGQEGIENLWPQLVDQQAFKGQLAKTYRINGIPACLLFDPNGKLVTRNMRGSWMDGRLIDLYGNLFEQK